MKIFAVVMVLLISLPFYSVFSQREVAVAIFPFLSTNQSEEPLIANFTYSPSDVVVNRLVNFHDYSSGAITLWLWDFGDGVTDNATVREEANKTHMYAVSGDYLVSLTVFDSQGNSSVHEALIDVRKINTTLSLNMPDSGPPGSSFSLTAILRDEYGAPISSFPVAFYLVNEQSNSLIGSSYTDSIGHASINYTPPSSGVYQIKAVFNGTDVYAESISDLKTLQVGSDLVPYAVLASVLVLIMSISLAYIRLKRRGTEKEETLPEEEETSK
ncbi:MAG: PKD domain-containing protein [Candidatus Bathyarchaeia archaeon]|jgi:PKD repeat protein|nr:PKD domain-containing protein [Candidatus Bathyarchaeota archaeon A05DMB-4]MDH7594767.1 PKD domain-containing protein [Candidatus Bathyarchaeota archaeon]